MSPVASWLLPIHLTSAFSAAALFWMAALSGKGGRRHRAAGRWFARCVWLTAVSGAVLALAGLVVLDPRTAAAPAVIAAERQTLWFALYVLLVIVAPVQHGLAVVAAGPRPSGVRSLAHAGLTFGAMAGSLLIFPATVFWQRWPLAVLAPIGLVLGLRQLAYARRPVARREDWEREHLTSLVLAGVTLHTALLGFGTTRSLGLALDWPWSWLPWFLPALVGLPVLVRLRRSG